MLLLQKADSQEAPEPDGDNLRYGLNRDLGFTDADRVENIRRAESRQAAHRCRLYRIMHVHPALRCRDLLAADPAVHYGVVGEGSPSALEGT
jgi:Adenylylsulphate kinase